MYDEKLPSVKSALAAAGLNITFQNNNDLMKDLYLQDMYDPDRTDLDPNKNYVVPRENQLVYDVPNQMIYRCIYVDYEGDLKPTLKPWVNLAGQTTDLDDELNDTYGLIHLLNGERTLSVDYSILPNKARADARIVSPGAEYAKLFKGVSIGDTGKVISCTYDNSNFLVDDKVPVKLAEIKDSTNIMVMTTDKFSLTENAESLPIGSMCTLVFYDKENMMIPPAYPLYVQHGSFVKDNNLAKKYVIDIELVVPWFTNSDEPQVVNIPINVVLDTIEFRAIVYYSDGSKSGLLPLNGTRFSLLGIEHYKPSSPGSQFEMVLSYNLANNEEIYLAEPSTPRTKTKLYYFRAVNSQGAFSPKLYTMPCPNRDNGYDLKHYLYDLDRKYMFDVTDKVFLNQVSPAYNPTKYGQVQSLIYNLRLSEVSPMYVNYVYKQNVDVTLYRAPDSEGYRWATCYTNTMVQQRPLIGTQYKEDKVPKLNISGGIETLEEWLDIVYYSGIPVFDPYREQRAPEPNVFEIGHPDGEFVRYPIEDWWMGLSMPKTYYSGDTILIKFIKEYFDGSDLQLGLGAVVIE